MPQRITDPTDAAVKSEIIRLLGDLNPVSGVPGEFYTANRAADIREIVLEILSERT